jgi:hypothetical protein
MVAIVALVATVFAQMLAAVFEQPLLRQSGRVWFLRVSVA